jgi:hypothetical protein
VDRIQETLKNPEASP